MLQKVDKTKQMLSAQKSADLTRDTVSALFWSSSQLGKMNSSCRFDTLLLLNLPYIGNCLDFLTLLISVLALSSTFRSTEGVLDFTFIGLSTPAFLTYSDLV